MEIDSQKTDLTVQGRHCAVKQEKGPGPATRTQSYPLSKVKGPAMEEDTISVHRFRCHSTAVVIQESSTFSLGVPELASRLGRSEKQIRSTLRSSDWFLNNNPGITCFPIWTINPEKLMEIEEVTQKIPKSRFRKLRRSLNINRRPHCRVLLPWLIRHGLQLSASEFTVAQVKQLSQRDFSRDQVILHCPQLDFGKIYSLDKYKYKTTVKMSSMNADLMKRYLQEAVSQEENIRRAMKNPGQVQDMLKGQLKHGYDLTSCKSMSGFVIWDLEEKELGPKKNKKSVKPNKNFNSILIALALKNSVSGRLSWEQTVNFIESHFHGYNRFSSATRDVVQLTSRIETICKTTLYKNICKVLWIVTEAEPREETEFIDVGHILQNSKEMEAEERSLIKEENQLIDEIWTLEKEDALRCKHEIKIEEEEFFDYSMRQQLEE